MRRQLLALLVVPLIAASTAQAFAQAGEGDAGYAGGGGGGYGGPVFSGGYGGYGGAYGGYDVPAYAWEPEVRAPRLTLGPRRRARSSVRVYPN
jgi:hypothetical protein